MVEGCSHCLAGCIGNKTVKESLFFYRFEHIIKQKETYKRESLANCPNVYKEYTEGDHKACTKNRAKLKLTIPVTQL